MARATTQTDTQTVTPEEQPRFILGAGDGFNLLVPRRASGVPKAVQESSKNAEQAYDAAWQAGAEHRAARAAVKAAVGVDRANDAAAVAAGLPMPTERVTEAAQAALEAAQRRADAAQDNRRAAMLEHARTVARERETWLPLAQETVSTTREKALALLAELTETIDRLREETALADGLADWPEQGSLVVTSLGRVLTRYEDLAARSREDIAEELTNADRQGFSSRHLVDRDPDHLIVALAIEVRGKEPRTQLERAKW